jgi:hypothetical protein
MHERDFYDLSVILLTMWSILTEYFSDISYLILLVSDGILIHCIDITAGKVVPKIPINYGTSLNHDLI